jgi:hypothetical protein
VVGADGILRKIHEEKEKTGKRVIGIGGTHAVL